MPSGRTFNVIIAAAPDANIGLWPTSEAPTYNDDERQVLFDHVYANPFDGAGGGLFTDFTSDDGLLQTDESCPDLFGEVLAGSMEGSITTDVECRLSGTECVFNQPLEAALKAIAPEGSGIDFRVGAGHGSGANDPFFRDDAVLALLLVTGDNDCSTVNTEVFDPDSTTFGGALNLRCFQHSEELTPTARYVDSLLVSRSPDDLVYFVLGGIPPELDGVNPSELLTDPSMEERLDDDDPGRLEPSCSTAGSPVMNPPRRLLEVGDGLSDLGVAVGTGSACQTRYDAALERFATLALHTGCDCP